MNLLLSLKTANKTVLTTLTLATLLISCGGDNGSSSISPSLPGGESGGSPTSDVGDIQSSGFWVNIRTEGQFPAYVNNGTGFGTECQIPSDAENAQQMDCLIDVLEGDLYQYALKIQYNVPPDLCEHVAVETAWHWNQSFGQGPSLVNLTTTTTATGETVASSCEAYHDGLDTFVPCSNHPELYDVNNASGPKCTYDESESDGNNCCIGDYTITITDQENNVQVQRTEWGGDLSQCIGGLARQGWSTFDQASGLPIGLRTAIPESNSNSSGTDGTNTVGLNEELTFTSNASSTLSGSSLVSANFFETNGAPHSHTGYYDSRVSDLPYALDPIDDLDGSSAFLMNARRRANPSISFLCEDGGFENKHIINVYVREWNTYSDFVVYGTSGGTTYNPDVGGIEGTDCDYSDIFSTNCNDRLDFEDLLMRAGGSYDTSTGNPNTADSSRRNYFPNIDY